MSQVSAFRMMATYALKRVREGVTQNSEKHCQSCPAHFEKLRRRKGNFVNLSQKSLRALASADGTRKYPVLYGFVMHAHVNSSTRCFLLLEDSKSPCTNHALRSSMAKGLFL